MTTYFTEIITETQYNHNTGLLRTTSMLAPAWQIHTSHTGAVLTEAVVQ